MYTQCPHCQAYFEVTAEQLKVGGGDVRCGQCLSVFNAVQNLTESLPAPEEETASLYAEWAKGNPPPPEPQTETSPARPSPPAGHVEPPLGDIDAVATDIDPDPGLAAEAPAETSTVETASADAAPISGDNTDADAFTSQQIEAIEPAPEWVHEAEALGGANTAPDEVPPPTTPFEARRDEDPAEVDVTAESPATTADAAEEAAPREIYAEPIGDPVASEEDGPVTNLPAPLLRQLQEEKAASLRPPATPWVIGSLLMLLIFLAQASYFYRDELALRKPELRPWLEQACEVLGCRVRRPPANAHIDILGWDVRSLPDTPQALLASTTLVNKTPEPQPYPLLTLRFSDMNGKAVAQRRFLPREYLPADTDIKAGMPPDTPISVRLALVDPGKRAVNFEFHTEPGNLAQ